MSRISRLGEGDGNRKRKTVTPARGHKVRGKRKSFSSQFHQAESKALYEELDRLLGEIKKAGERLANEMTWDSFIYYRDNIRAFLHTISNQAYKIFGEKGRNSKGHQKVFIVVKTVDQKLAEIRAEVMKNEQDRLEVISKMDEIRGLLLDLYH